MYTTPRCKLLGDGILLVARSNSNDGCCEAYLWFNISYLHKKNATLNGNKIPLNLAHYL